MIARPTNQRLHVVSSVTRAALAWDRTPRPPRHEEPPAPPVAVVPVSEPGSFLREHWPEIQRFANTRLRPRTLTVTEFASEIAVYVAERIGDYDPERGPVHSWIWNQARAARTRIIRADVHQKQKFVHLYEEDGTDPMERFGAPDDAESRIDLQRIMDRASPREVVWIRAQLDGATQEEQAAMAGVGPRAVRAAGMELRTRIQEENHHG